MSVSAVTARVQSGYLEHMTVVCGLTTQVRCFVHCEMDTATLTGLIIRGLLHKENSRLTGHLKGIF